MSILIGIFTVVLIFVSLFLILVVLMQKAKSDGGVGAAMGGGMAEATFGADTGNVLSTATIWASVAFFVLSFGLYLGYIFQMSHAHPTGGALPTISAPAKLPEPTSTPTDESKTTAPAAPTVAMPEAPAPAAQGATQATPAP